MFLSWAGLAATVLTSTSTGSREGRKQSRHRELPLLLPQPQESSEHAGCCQPTSAQQLSGSLSASYSILSFLLELPIIHQGTHRVFLPPRSERALLWQANQPPAVLTLEDSNPVLKKKEEQPYTIEITPNHTFK